MTELDGIKRRLALLEASVSELAELQGLLRERLSNQEKRLAEYIHDSE